MNNPSQTVPLSFRVHFIQMNGPEINPMVRVLLVETTKAKLVYEIFGPWGQCRRWVDQLSECVIFGDEFAAIQRRLEMNRLATIKEIHISLCDLESAGFCRVDCCAKSSNTPADSASTY